MKFTIEKVSILIGIGFTILFGVQEYKKREIEINNLKIKKNINTVQLQESSCTNKHRLLDIQVKQIRSDIDDLKTLKDEKTLKRVECHYDLNECENMKSQCESSLDKSVNQVCTSFIQQQEQLLKGYIFVPAKDIPINLNDVECKKTLDKKSKYIKKLNGDLKYYQTFKFITSIKECRRLVKNCKSTVLNCAEKLNLSCPSLEIDVSQLFDETKLDVTTL